MAKYMWVACFMPSCPLEVCVLLMCFHIKKDIENKIVNDNEKHVQFFFGLFLYIFSTSSLFGNFSFKEPIMV